jgi:hypothetical protein
MPTPSTHVRSMHVRSAHMPCYTHHFTCFCAPIFSEHAKLLRNQTCLLHTAHVRVLSQLAVLSQHSFAFCLMTITWPRCLTRGMGEQGAFWYQSRCFT